jgi:hypothetical protein
MGKWLAPVALLGAVAASLVSWLQTGGWQSPLVAALCLVAAGIDVFQKRAAIRRG